MERGVLELPLRLLAPVRLLELVLHVEQPDAGGARDENDRHLDEEERYPADEPDEAHDEGRDGEVGDHRRCPRHAPAAHQADRQPVLDDEEPERPEPEHHQRVAIEPVADPAPERPRVIFGNGEGDDIADAARIEIAARGVVDRVGAPPAIVGGESQDADGAADPVIDLPYAEEGAVAAIVLDHEEPQQEPGGRDGEEEPPPEAVLHRNPGQNPERDQGDDGDPELEDTPQPVRRAIGHHALQPFEFGRRGGSLCGIGHSAM